MISKYENVPRVSKSLKKKIKNLGSAMKIWWNNFAGAEKYYERNRKKNEHKINM